MNNDHLKVQLQLHGEGWRSGERGEVGGGGSSKAGSDWFKNAKSSYLTRSQEGIFKMDNSHV